MEGAETHVVRPPARELNVVLHHIDNAHRVDDTFDVRWIYVSHFATILLHMHNLPPSRARLATQRSPLALHPFPSARHRKGCLPSEIGNHPSKAAPLPCLAVGQARPTIRSPYANPQARVLSHPARNNHRQAPQFQLLPTNTQRPAPNKLRPRTPTFSPHNAPHLPPSITERFHAVKVQKIEGSITHIPPKRRRYSLRTNAHQIRT